jgi:putative DNA primase/helicase
MADAFTDPAPAAAGSLTFAAFLDRFDVHEDDGNGYAVICPSHEDTSPSLRVAYNADRKTLVLKCRVGCRTADVVSALGLRMADLFNVEPGDMTDVKSAGAVPEPVSIQHRAALAMYLGRAHSKLEAHDAESHPASEYAEARFGISETRARDLGLGFDPGNIPSGVVVLSRDLYRDTPRLVVPFNDFDGHPHYFQARSIDPKYKGRAKWSGPANPEGMRWGVYGWFPGDLPWDEIIVTEGPGDGLTANGAGYDTLLIRGAAMGLPDDVLADLSHRFPDRTFVLAGDPDKGGQQFNRIVGERLSSVGLRAVVLQLPGVDLSDWRKQDPDAFYPAFTEAATSAPAWEPPAPESAPALTAPAPSVDMTGDVRTELGNALRLVHRMGGRLRYSKALGFLVWNGISWQIDHTDTVRAAAQQSAMDLMAEARAMPDSKAKDAALKWAAESQRSRAIDAVLTETKALPGVAISPDALDAKPDLLAVRNGTINLRTGELKPSDPEDLLTVALDIEYDPDAEAPRWNQFLGECFPDAPTVPDYLRRLVGYGITGYATEHCYVMLHGRGGNGKSVFTTALYDTFRAVTQVVPIETFLAAGSVDGSGPSSDVAALRGARLVLTSEAESGARMADAKLKRLTGGDPVSARHLYKDPFTFLPQFLLMLSTNAIPEVRDNSDGIWRRLKIVEWKQQFTGKRKDTSLSAKLRAERAGILAWAVRGAAEWFRQGLGEPTSVTETVDMHRAEADKLLEFYPGVIVDDPAGWIERAELYALYREWTEREGNHPWQPRTLYDELRARGVEQSGRKGKRGFKGIRPARPSEKSADPRAQESALTDMTTDSASAPDLETFTP